ncbi:TOBE domain-containing protein, partial [Cryobacterium sp. TMT1-2-1]
PPRTGTVHCALGRLPAEWVAGPPQAGDDVTVLVRPEEVEIAPATDEPGRTATVTGVSYTGHDAMLDLLLDGGLRIRSRVTAADLQPAGARVSVRVRGRVLAYPGSPALP